MNGKIIKNMQICGDHFLLSVKLPKSFNSPLPGQFVMVREKGRIDPLLGRPFSVYSFELSKYAAIIEILYKVVGRGTLLLSKLKKGDPVEIFGPYGRAFDVSPEAKTVAFICGGIGIAPITFLISRYKNLSDMQDVEFICYYGAVSANNLVGFEQIREMCSEVHVSTDDGSEGYKGFVTELFAKNISLYDTLNSKIYACGPRPMLQRLSKLLVDNPLPCQILMEERMACGVGACLGCAVSTKQKEGKIEYKRVCKDGPVFNIEEIAWS
ncbi:MAG: dihydroorotate dehydrogenase electron transfer subunit [Syntrophaceae bacterium]